MSLTAAAAERERRGRGTHRPRVRADARSRSRSRELAAELERLTDAVHRDEVARAEQRLRIEALEERSLREWGVPVDELLRRLRP